MDARADLLLALKRIDDAAKIGESKFLKALADKATDRTGNVEGILGDIRDMQKEKGSTAAIEYIRRMLDVAAIIVDEWPESNQSCETDYSPISVYRGLNHIPPSTCPD